MKSRTKYLHGLIATSLVLISSSSFAVDSDCDTTCQKSLEFTKAMDEKKRTINQLQSDLQIARLEKELASLSVEESKDEQTGTSLETDLNERIEALEAQLMERISTLSSSMSEGAASSLEGATTDLTSQQTSGIANVFVTGTSAVDNIWTATIYYNNTIEKLSVGDEVFPGAKIASINRRGMVVDVGGVEHIKKLTSSSIAYAKTFSNIKKSQSQSTPSTGREQPSQYKPPYGGY